MVLYFTGTGNSRHIAERIAHALGDELVSLNDRIKAGDTTPLAVNDRLVLVTPTYAWRIPRIVEEHLRQTGLHGAKKIWFVMDCGSEIGNAEKYNRALCREKGVTYMGTAQIVMPENCSTPLRSRRRGRSSPGQSRSPTAPLPRSVRVRCLRRRAKTSMTAL